MYLLVPEESARRSAAVFAREIPLHPSVDVSGMTPQQQSLEAEKLYLEIRQKLNALYAEGEAGQNYADVISRLEAIRQML